MQASPETLEKPIDFQSLGELLGRVGVKIPEIMLVCEVSHGTAVDILAGRGMMNPRYRAGVGLLKLAEREHIEPPLLDDSVK